MKEAGAILLLAGLVGLFYFQFEFDETLNFNSGKNTYTKPYNPYDNDYVKLIRDKQNFTYISIGVTLTGVVLMIAGIRKSKKYGRR